MFLSLIIPAYNEADRIGPSLQKAFEYFANVDYDVEVIVVDDGSTDSTINAVEQSFSKKPVELVRVTTRLLSLGSNKGKGAAVRKGMLEANGRVRMFADADFSTPIQEVERLLPHISSGDYDVVIGSRAAEGRKLVKKHQPWYREAMGRLFNFLVQALVFRGIRDTQCGFKGFSELAATMLFSKQKVMGFSFDVEILYLARKYGYRTREIAIEWYNDERSTVGAFSDSAKMFWELLRVRNLHKHDR